MIGKVNDTKFEDGSFHYLKIFRVRERRLKNYKFIMHIEVSYIMMCIDRKMDENFLLMFRYDISPFSAFDHSDFLPGSKISLFLFSSLFAIIAI